MSCLDAGILDKVVSNSRIQVRRMDTKTQQILHVQFNAIHETWMCLDCRANVSVWATKCHKCCHTRRGFHTPATIDPDGWLCSMYVVFAFLDFLTVLTILICIFWLVA